MSEDMDDVEDIYELTALQEGMLFHTLYAPESSVYTIQLDIGVDGPLDARTVEGAWAAVLSRHGALRTSFIWERMEKPYQLVHREVNAAVAWHDWSAFDSAQQAALRAAFLVEDRAQLFDLTQAPPIRLTALHLGSDRHRLIWTFHHIILEGWSATVVLKAFWEAYTAVRTGRAVGDEPAAVPYAEYLRWLRRQDVVRAEAHWRSALAGLQAPTAMPIDSGAAGGPAAVHDVLPLHISLTAEQHQVVQNFARSQRVTLNTVLHGVWAILLSRYSGDDDVAFGTVVSGRPTDLPGAETIVGLFVNTLPARVMVDAGMALTPWLRQLQLGLASMREYGYSSLVDVQSWSGIPADRPLFHTLLAFENWLDVQAQPGDGLTITDRVVCEASDQPLTLFVTFDPTLTLTLMYDTDRFEAVAVQRMLGHASTLLLGMAESPHATLGELPMLTPAERTQLLVDWNRTDTPYPRDRTIGQLFAEQAAATPEAIALEHLGQRMSYRELAERADRLASFLQGLDVAHETPVALMVERGFDMVVGVLGILQAGAAYLPLDPAYPTSRLTFMLDDAAAPVLLTQAALADRLPPFSGRVVALDTDWPSIAQAPAHPAATAASATSLAYLMYTSGSTGRPKGTCIEHRSVVRLVKDTRFVELGPQQVFLQYAPISFDASTFELWGCLLNGSRLVICAPGLQSLSDLGRLIRESGVTVLWLTSALFNQMVNEQSGSLRGVRQLLVGGEAVSVRHARQMLESMDASARLINGYGPTENTTFTTTFAMTPETRLDRSVPIGRPISNTRVYILDRHRQPVPVGVYGELYIGGDGLARGYLHQPELTARSFVADPFAATLTDKSDARLYRSGDLVRYREDGCIEFAGRIDRQVKLYGLRLEPGEVEAALQKHPQVIDATAVVLGLQPEARRLVAYVVGSRGDVPTSEALRAYLRDTLPASLVPGAFVMLDALPLTPNGKVDHDALPEPETARPLATPYVLPRNERELRIAATWQEVLRIERAGLDDNFFDLGGNSLLVMRVHSRLQAAGEAALKVVDLFRHPTVRSLAAHLSGTQEPAAAAGTDVEALEDRARKRRQAQRRQQKA